MVWVVASGTVERNLFELVFNKDNLQERKKFIFELIKDENNLNFGLKKKKLLI